MTGPPIAYLTYFTSLRHCFIASKLFYKYLYTNLVIRFKATLKNNYFSEIMYENI